MCKYDAEFVGGRVPVFTIFVPLFFFHMFKKAVK